MLRAATAERGRRGGLARREAIEGYLFILPWIVGLFVFTLGPFLGGFALSLTDFSGLETPSFVGLENYVAAVGDARFRLSIYNTIYYVVLSVPLSMTLGFLLALLLNQQVVALPFFRTALYMPAIVPAVPSVALFIWILHDRFGLLNGLLNSVGIPGPPWLTGPDWTKPSLILWTLWQAGGGMVIYLAGLQGVPHELYEAAAIDGAGVVHRFRHVTLPMMSPTIFFQLTMGIIASFQVFTAVYILGVAYDFGWNAGPGDSLLFWVVHIYWQGFFFFKQGYASALASLLFAVVLLVTLIQLRLSRRWVYYEADAAGR